MVVEGCGECLSISLDSRVCCEGGCRGCMSLSQAAGFGMGISGGYRGCVPLNKALDHGVRGMRGMGVPILGLQVW